MKNKAGIIGIIITIIILIVLVIISNISTGNLSFIEGSVRKNIYANTKWYCLFEK